MFACITLHRASSVGEMTVYILSSYRKLSLLSLNDSSSLEF